MVGFDVVRTQDVAEISELDDPAVRATGNDRVVLTRVVLTQVLSTMIPAMQEQVKRFASCSPIVLVRDSLPVTLVIEEILLLDECSIETDSWWYGLQPAAFTQGR